MTVGPDGAPYFIGPASDGSGKSVWRFDSKRDRVWEIIKTGRRVQPAQGIATPATAGRPGGRPAHRRRPRRPVALAAVQRQERRVAHPSRASPASRCGATTSGTWAPSSRRSSEAPTTCTSWTPAWTRSCATRRPSTAGSSRARTTTCRRPTRPSRTSCGCTSDRDVYALTPHERGQAHQRPAAGLRPRDTARRWRPPPGSPVPAHRRHVPPGTAVRLRREVGPDPGVPQVRRQLPRASGRPGARCRRWRTCGACTSASRRRRGDRRRRPRPKVIWATPDGLYSTRLSPVAEDSGSSTDAAPTAPRRHPSQRAPQSPPRSRAEALEATHHVPGCERGLRGERPCPRRLGPARGPAPRASPGPVPAHLGRALGGERHRHAPPGHVAGATADPRPVHAHAPGARGARHRGSWSPTSPMTPIGRAS